MVQGDLAHVMALNLFRLRVVSCGQVPFLYQAGHIPACHYGSEVSPDLSPSRKFPSVATQPSGLKRGTGGRSSFSGKVVTVFGASGFLGRYVVNQLGKVGSQVIIPYRADASVVRGLKLCGDLGQILFMPYNLKDEGSLYKAMKYSNVVINLIGRNFETPNFSFEDVHVKGARNIARIAQELGVRTFIHLSALNACEHPKPIILKKGSGFLASKWRGEVAVKEEFPDAVIIRPSDIFGKEDNFLRYYASSLRHSWRFISAWKRGDETIKQPVYVSDIAKGIVRATFDADTAGKTYQAVGPHRYQLGELLDWFHRILLTDHETYKRIDSRYDPMIWIKLFTVELMSSRVKKMSWERMEREYVTDEISYELPTLEDLGVKLTPLEDRIFHELKLYRAHAYVDPMLTHYVRPVEPAPFAKS